MIEQEIQQCSLCLEELESDLFFFGCHIFHRECVRKQVESGLGQGQFPIKCPQEGCPNTIDYRAISQLSQPKLLQKFVDFSLKDFLSRNNKETIHCPTPNCPFAFQFQFTCDQPANMKVRRRCKQCDKYFCKCRKQIECEVCKKQICLFCRQIHPGLSCYQHNHNKELNNGFNLFVRYIKEAKFKKCPNCEFWVEKSVGCNHMVCRCGNQFCYECNGPYMKCFCQRGKQVVKRMVEQIYPNIKPAYKPVTPGKELKKKPKPIDNRSVLKAKLFAFPEFSVLRV